MTSPSPRAMNQRTSSFDDAAENFGDWVRVHSKQVAIGVGVVAVVVVGAALWRSSASSKNNRAETAFLQAQAPLVQGNVPAAQQQLQQVAQRYDGTAGGAQAQLLLAQTYFDQGKYQEGLNVLKEADDAPDALRNSVRLLTAVGYEGLGQPAEAAKRFEEAAGDAKTEPERLQLQADAARAYQAAGNKDAALRLWSELAKVQGPGISDEARVRVGELTAKSAR
jgi:tetratricopeptide (TPR) repeat protein